MIDGIVADNPKNLPVVYRWAKMKLAIYNHRKLFGLSYRQAMDEPFDEFLTNAKINKLIDDKITMENKKNG